MFKYLVATCLTFSCAFSMLTYGDLLENYDSYIYKVAQPSNGEELSDVDKFNFYAGIEHGKLVNKTKLIFAEIDAEGLENFRPSIIEVSVEPNFKNKHLLEPYIADKFKTYMNDRFSLEQNKGSNDGVSLLVEVIDLSDVIIDRFSLKPKGTFHMVDLKLKTHKSLISEVPHPFASLDGLTKEQEKILDRYNEYRTVLAVPYQTRLRVFLENKDIYSEINKMTIELVDILKSDVEKANKLED